MEFYKSFLKFIESQYPKSYHALAPQLPSSLLFSSAIVEIKKSDLEKIKQFIKIAFQLTRTEGYIKAISAELPDIAKLPAKNFSAFMSYDFHVTPQGPKLIEINTNASLSSFAFFLSDFQKQKLGSNYLGSDFLAVCRKMLLEEHSYFNYSAVPQIAITDEAPTHQKAYSEFLFYNSLFKEWGWNSEVVDTKDLVFDKETKKLRSASAAFDFVYNRNTDFYFETPSTEEFKKAYLDSSVCISPNPREYGLLADKERLLNLSSSEFLQGLLVSHSDIELLTSVIPKIIPISKLDRLTPKKERENYFFKPRRSFGGKAVYRGKTLSQKTFEDILLKDYLAQELVEPPSISVNTDEGTKDFKWDLRVYAYKDQTQLMIARLYQGQMTNTQTPGGGLAPIRTID